MQNEDSSIINEWGRQEKPEGFNDSWRLIASSDDSPDYGIDVLEVWKTDDGYAVLSATGCSCWEGEYDTNRYNNLAQLAIALFNEGQGDYTPSAVRALDLLQQVFTND